MEPRAVLLPSEPGFGLTAPAAGQGSRAGHWRRKSSPARRRDPNRSGIAAAALDATAGLREGDYLSYKDSPSSPAAEAVAVWSRVRWGFVCPQPAAGQRVHLGAACPAASPSSAQATRGFRPVLPAGPTAWIFAGASADRD